MLEYIKSQFYATFTKEKIQKAKHFSLNKEFQSKLLEASEKFTELVDSDSLRNGQVENSRRYNWSFEINDKITDLITKGQTTGKLGEFKTHNSKCEHLKSIEHQLIVFSECDSGSK
jgi:hypothetical protein